jgi:hypothetical protein
MAHRSRPRAFGLALAALLCGAAAAQAQVQVGSETQLNLDGNVSTGYSGSITNAGSDSHGITFGGSGNLGGSFHSPQFLSFDVSPFFNQSRNNSNFQSITDSSGVTASANIFGGSQFPGYFNYSRIYNSESTYSLPGVANYATNANSQTFGVGWSANLKSLPNFTFGYQQGSTDYSLYGTPQEDSNNFHSAFGLASYTVDGFHLSGGIHYSNSSSLFPEVAAGEQPDKASSNNTTYTFSLGRSLFWGGSAWFNFTRNNASYDSAGYSNSETSDLLVGGVSLKPTDKLSAQFSMDYNDNLAGTVFQTIIGTGSTTPISLTQAPSHSWGVYGGAQYMVTQGLLVSGSISHRQQLFLGQQYDSTAFTGSVNYGHNLLGGQFTAGVNVTHSDYAFRGGSILGLIADVIYIRRFGAWNVSGSVGYSQNVQSLLVAYTTSGYSYSTSVTRPIGRLIWTSGASGSRTLLTETQGTTNSTQGYTTGLSGRWLGVSAGYSKASGSGLLTPTGITTLPPGIPPTLVSTVLYGGTSYSASVGSTPRRGLTITGTYLHSRSNTAGDVILSNNSTEQAYAYLTYRFRKVYFNAGYSRLLQGFSASGLIPTKLTAYYAGVSRWFKVF